MFDPIHSPMSERRRAQQALWVLAVCWSLALPTGLVALSLLNATFSTKDVLLMVLLMLALAAAMASNGYAFLCASGSRTFGAVAAACSLVPPLTVVLMVFAFQGLIRAIDDPQTSSFGSCPKCDYTLVGTRGDVCPECGWSPRPHA